MKMQNFFSGKIKKNIISLSAAEFAQRGVNVCKLPKTLEVKIVSYIN